MNKPQLLGFTNVFNSGYVVLLCPVQDSIIPGLVTLFLFLKLSPVVELRTLPYEANEWRD